MSFAELYDVAFSWSPQGELDSLSTLWNAVLRRAPQKICDVGAGTGRFMLPLLQSGFDCIGVEPDPEMVAVLSAKCARSELRPKIFNANFEDTILPAGIDCIIAMTDVLSCVFPTGRLSGFLRHSRRTLAPGGAMIVDVALWSGYPGESRKERWATDSPAGGVITAECMAVIQPFYRHFPLIRIERLALERKTSQEFVFESREALLHAFEWRRLIDMFAAAKLEFAGAVTPNGQVCSSLDKAPRAFMAFVKAAY